MVRIALPALLLLPALQDKGARKLEFKLPPGSLAEYALLDRAGRPATAPPVLVFGSELLGASNRFGIDRYDDIPLALAFQLPPLAFKSGVAWDVSLMYFDEAQESAGGGGPGGFFGGAGLRPVQVRGRIAVKGSQKKGDDEILTFDGSFTFYETRRQMVNNQMRTQITKNDLGLAATSVQFSIARGLPVRIGWQLRLKGQDREGGRIVDRRFDTHVVLELKEDRVVDAAAVAASGRAAADRAVARLKALQKGDGEWIPDKPQVLRTESAAVTARVVRSLVAAGLPPGDPALVAASRSLRAPMQGPLETALVAQIAHALGLLEGDKDAADQARKLGEDLLRRQDPRGLWTNGGPNAAPSLVVSAQVLEALAVCPGLRISDETWKRALDGFLQSAMEDGEEVTLDLAFDADPPPFAPDPKTVPSQGWPPQQAAPDDLMAALRGRQRGTALTALAALSAIETAASKLTLDEKGRQNVDQARRRGLAHLQRRWTLRTVPPAEGAWSAQRIEYLDRLGDFLARTKISKVSGSDWRSEGILLLLREQAADGSWNPGTVDAAARTAHALAFLASAAPRRP
jgi:hypothetical protein